MLESPAAAASVSVYCPDLIPPTAAFPCQLYLTVASVTAHCKKNHMNNCCTVSMIGLFGKHLYRVHFPNVCRVIVIAFPRLAYLASRPLWHGGCLVSSVLAFVRSEDWNVYTLCLKSHDKNFKNVQKRNLLWKPLQHGNVCCMRLTGLPFTTERIL